MERRLFQVPDSTTITMWMMKKARKENAQMKWIVRALCRPPNSHRSCGKAESTVGYIVRPVRTISGPRMKITVKYVIFCNAL